MNEMNDEENNLHRQAWDLIPWVAAGSASEAESQRVRAHLRSCGDCRQEMAFHQDLVHSLRSSSPDLPAPEPALQQLWARIDRGSSAAAAPATASKLGAANTRWLMVAVWVQAAGLVAMAGWLMKDRQDRPGQRDASFQTLSTVTAAPTALLQLVPAKTMPVGELAAMLSANGLQIVASNQDGTVLGLALQAPPTLTTPTTLATLQALALRLRQAPGVLLAEPTAVAMGR
jgi:anti-sigma factor RsiW